MRTRIPAILVLISASFAFGQLDSNSVTVSASRTATPQPDQAIFGVFVSSSVSTNLSDVVTALQGSGITLANFSSVTTGVAINAVAPIGLVTRTLQWAFALIVPLSNTKGTVATLTGLQQSIPQKNSGLSLSFSLQGTQVSQQLQQSQPCAIPELLADARAQAQSLAASGGRTLSGILALSSATSSNAGFANPIVSPGFLSSTSFSLPPICTVTVKFALLGS